MARHENVKHDKLDINKKTIKFKTRYVFFILIILFIMINVKNLYAYFTDFMSMPNQITVHAEYIVTFNNNTGTGTMQNQSISYNVVGNLRANTFTKTGYIFNGWNTEPNGTGTGYMDKQGVLNLGDITLYAQWLNSGNVAEINGTYYSSLQDAIDAVPTDNTETTIILLQNTSEVITVGSGKNIVFDFQNNTLSNNGNNNVIVNTGRIRFISGTITSSATYGAVDNNAGGTFIMTGGNIIATGARQAIYNDGGTLEISGTAYLSSSTNQRATVQNLSSGNVTITGGTIVSTGSAGINNTANLTIGIKDGTSDITTPVIQGVTQGISSTTNFNFYDGILKGKTSAVNDETKIQDTEVGYVFAHATETINNQTYRTLYFGNTYTVTFDANGGTLNDINEQTRTRVYGEAVGTLPVATRPDYILEGWNTAGGVEVTASTPITADITIYARWVDVNAAQIGGTKYATIQLAVQAVPTDGTQTTIRLLRTVPISERITIASNQNVVLDMQNYTINNTSGTIPVIEVFGTLSISSGTIKTAANQGAVNVKSSGTFNFSGGSIIATGTRQGIYNDGGTTNISGTASVSATSNERPAVQNNSGTMYITGGTITSSRQVAVQNKARLTIGTSDGNVDITNPMLQGATYGVTNSGSLFNFYDGVIKGVTDAISGTVNNIESGYTRTNSTEFIDGTTYKTTFLQ